MSKHHKFKLKMTHWKDELYNRTLQSEEHTFESLEEAKKHFHYQEHKHKHKKIYDIDDQIVYADLDDSETYA
jgi:hypothetical protein